MSQEGGGGEFVIQSPPPDYKSGGSYFLAVLRYVLIKSGSWNFFTKNVTTSAVDKSNHKFHHSYVKNTFFLESVVASTKIGFADQRDFCVTNPHLEFNFEPSYLDTMSVLSAKTLIVQFRDEVNWIYSVSFSVVCTRKSIFRNKSKNHNLAEFRLGAIRKNWEFHR